MAEFYRAGEGVPSRAKEDQALWDKAMLTAIHGEMSCQSNATKRLAPMDLVLYSSAIADAFMAERAKRMENKQ